MLFVSNNKYYRPFLVTKFIVWQQNSLQLFKRIRNAGSTMKHRQTYSTSCIPAGMTRADVVSSSETIGQENTQHHRDWIRAITYDDDYMVREIIEQTPVESRYSNLLNVHLQLHPRDTEYHGPVRNISTTIYSPETPWCLAAMMNSRKVMKVLAEYRANCLQVTPNGNNMLHVLVAFVSTGGDLQEELALTTVAYIKDLIGDDDYAKLLLVENGNGLRPLELACHLGTLGLFMYFFTTPEVYITREEDHILYKRQFFDVTEYISGPRYIKSPIYAMAYMDENKFTSKHAKDAYLSEPMRSWSNIILRVNLPYIAVWFVVRVLYITLFLVCDLNIKDISARYDNCTNKVELSTDANLVIYLVVLVLSILMITANVFDFVSWIFCHPSWLYRHVYGRKPISSHRMFYRLLHFFSVMVVTVATTIALINYYTNSNTEHAVEIGVLAGVYGFVWSLLYFMQLMPMFGYYVMAVQRILKDFVNFSFLLSVFFMTYAIGFYKLLRNDETVQDFKDFPISFYSTFRVMINLVEFYDPNGHIGFVTYTVHVTFVFMVAILLINFLIATLSSSYDHMMRYREVMYQMQCLSVSVAADHTFVRLLTPFRTFLRRRLFVYENGRYYVTRVIAVPTNQNDCIWCILASNIKVLYLSS